MALKRLLTGLSFCVVLCSSCVDKIVPPSKPRLFQQPFMVVSASDTVTPAKQGGIYYMLPKTRMEVTLQMRKTELVKGPFSAYAGKYLGIDNVINNNATNWQIEEIRINTIPVPDTEQLCYVALGNADSSSIPVNLHINISNIGTLTGAVRMDNTGLPENTSISNAGVVFSNVFKYYAESNLFETIDTVIERVLMDSVTVEKTVFKTKMVEKPLEQRAKETADLIQKLKDDRLSLLTGYQEVPYDPQTIRYMDGELIKMEREYMELFTGITIHSTATRTFSFTPEPDYDCIPIPIARYSVQDGLLPLESKKGEVLYIQCCSQGVSEAKKRFPVAPPVIIPDSLINTMARDLGFIYRIPEWSMVSVYLGTKVQKEIGIQIPQFGTTARLPWFVTKFTMDPNTGAILEIKYP